MTRGSSDGSARAPAAAAGSVLELRPRPATGELRALSQQAEAFAQRHRLRRDRIDAMLLALEEAVTNVLLYAFVGMPEEKRDVCVRLRMTPEALVVTILDNGPPFDPTHAPAPPEDAEEGSGGWGIRLMRGLVDAVRYERIGDRNELELVVRT